MSRRTVASIKDDRLIDFIFQYSPEEQFETLNYTEDHHISARAGLWHRLVNWVSKN